MPRSTFRLFALSIVIAGGVFGQQGTFAQIASGRTPEHCSESSRNRVHVPPETARVR